MSGILITNLIVFGLMVLIYNKVKEPEEMKWILIGVLGLWFIVQILPTGCQPDLFIGHGVN
jgi:hypothetical protein